MSQRIRETQLTLLGTLDTANIRIHLHTHSGMIDRNWWIEGFDEDGNRILLWSERTPEGPHGGIQLAELLARLLEISRLLRIPSQPPG